MDSNLTMSTQLGWGGVQDATSIYVAAARSMVQRRLLGSAHHQQYEEAYGHSFSLVEMAPEWREHFQLEYERARLEALDDPDAFTTDELFGLNLFGLIRPPTSRRMRARDRARVSRRSELNPKATTTQMHYA